MLSLGGPSATGFRKSRNLVHYRGNNPIVRVHYKIGSGSREQHGARGRGGSGGSDLRYGIQIWSPGIAASDELLDVSRDGIRIRVTHNIAMDSRHINRSRSRRGGDGDCGGIGRYRGRSRGRCNPVSVSVSFLLLDSASAGPWRMQTCVMRLRPYLLLATRRRPYSRPPRQAQLRTSSSSLRSPPRHTSSVKHAPSETKTHAPPSMLPLLLAMLRSFVTSFLSSSSSCRCPNAHTQR